MGMISVMFNILLRKYRKIIYHDTILIVYRFFNTRFNALLIICYLYK